MGILFWRKPKYGIVTPYSERSSVRSLRRAHVSITNFPIFDPHKIAWNTLRNMFGPPVMVRVIFDDGTTSGWYKYETRKPVMAIETCAPDQNGLPRYVQHKLGC